MSLLALIERRAAEPARPIADEHHRGTSYMVEGVGDGIHYRTEADARAAKPGGVVVRRETWFVRYVGNKKYKHVVRFFVVG